jgi:hypothetical protein
MSRRLDFNQDFRNRQARYGLNVKDETEWMKNDAAARWLQKNENRTLSGKLAVACQIKKLRLLQGSQRAEKRLKRRHAAIDPADPHDQLPGVDMRRGPWR